MLFSIDSDDSLFILFGQRSSERQVETRRWRIVVRISAQQILQRTPVGNELVQSRRSNPDVSGQTLKVSIKFLLYFVNWALRLVKICSMCFWWRDHNMFYFRILLFKNDYLRGLVLHPFSPLPHPVCIRYPKAWKTFKKSFLKLHFRSDWICFWNSGLTNSLNSFLQWSWFS